MPKCFVAPNAPTSRARGGELGRLVTVSPVWHCDIDHRTLAGYGRGWVEAHALRLRSCLRFLHELIGVYSRLGPRWLRRYGVGWQI
jgi:hypothetical protein